MTIQSIASILESWAPLEFAENYDNVGLITGDRHAAVTGVLICLDSTEYVVREALDLGCNMIIAHHPILFKGLKKITGDNYVERTIIQAIRNEIAIYALHTNLDNIISGVNSKIGQLLGLQNVQILQPRPGSRHEENITGAGLIGHLPNPISGIEFLQRTKEQLQLSFIKHTGIPDQPISTVAVCGGAGSFLIPLALQSGANAFLTADLKYHEYFDAEGRLLLLDVGHYESERFTINLVEEFLKPKVNGTPIYKTRLSTNPVYYFV
ncbi:MAG: Nif3-like dinuclear metal center hexameric protein [Saprospiraceae bacterium]|nr:Nif3-like dinuclear metal center hexameric protein [Saprospiraceae bacterium]